MTAIPRVLTKTVAASATPEALGAATVLFTSVTFIGQKAYGTDNTGDVHIQLKNASDVMTDALTVSPGQERALNIDPGFGKQFKASDVYIRVATNADGVRAIYNSLT